VNRERGLLRRSCEASFDAFGHPRHQHIVTEALPALLRIVNRDHKAPFDMSLPHYTQQLVAGHSQTKPNLGLVVYMPDFATLKAKDSSAVIATHQK